MARTDPMHTQPFPPGAGLTYTASADSASWVINLHEPQELSDWMRWLGCNEEGLRRAIAAVGPEVEAVCNHLGALLPAQALDMASGNGTAH